MTRCGIFKNCVPLLWVSGLTLALGLGACAPKYASVSKLLLRQEAERGASGMALLKKSPPALSAKNSELQLIASAGSIVRAWIDARAEGLSGPDVPGAAPTQDEAYPISSQPTPDKPGSYSLKSIRENFGAALAALPPPLQERLRVENRNPDSQFPVELTWTPELTRALEKVSRSAMAAAHWLALYPDRETMQKAFLDVRPWLEFKAAWMSKHPSDSEAANPEWIDRANEMCGFLFNTPRECRAYLEEDPLPTMERYISVGQEKFDGNFEVTDANPLVQATSSNGELQLRVRLFFTETPDAALLALLKRIEKNWTIPGQLRLTLELSPTEEGAVKVMIVPDVVPQVRSGGSVILLNPSLPRQTLEAEIALSHEFGHVLGFEDCNVEFWDESGQQFLYYALDPSNRMCAASGKTLPKHVELLRRAYLKAQRNS